jgi:formylglycine-generating enzyme required for sulfatase activity
MDRSKHTGRSRVRNAVRHLAAVAALAVTLPAAAQSCAGDIVANGVINGADLGTLLSFWGPRTSDPFSVASDVDGNGVVNGADLGLVLSNWGPCPASVFSIVPNAGVVSGGATITITGAYLALTTGITVGGVVATNVTVVNATTLIAVTPPGAPGNADVVITGGHGTITVPGGFRYVTAVIPSWATLVEENPNPAVVTNATLRAAIEATGFAWRIRDNSSNIEMLLVPGGTFTMGCSGSTQYGCGSDESPTHQVTLTNAFYMGRYEVTQAEWTAKMGSNPSYFSGYSDSPSRPVEQVSWNMITSGSTSFMSLTGLRLPTEAEWEYAYRAGTTTAFHSMPGYPNGTNDDNQVGTIAWYSSNSGSQTHAVGGKAANALGLHDMSGNVLEWVNDWYGSTYYSVSPLTNPRGPVSGSVSGSYRVLRGGAWSSGGFANNGNGTRFVRSSHRYSSGPVNAPVGTYNHFGFRVARIP